MDFCYLQISSFYLHHGLISLHCVPSQNHGGRHGLGGRRRFCRLRRLRHLLHLLVVGVLVLLGRLLHQVPLVVVARHVVATSGE